MKKKMFFLGSALFVLMFTSWGNAQEPTYTNVFDQIRNAKDVEAVRMVILREIQGFLKADPEQVFSCYDADNFVGYSLYGNPDPKTWTIGTVGRNDIRKYADTAKDFLGFETKNPGVKQVAEIQHVQVKDNNALAVARQYWEFPDKAKGKTTIRDFESVFLLKKNTKGEWKITGWIGGATWKNEVVDFVNE
jgi:hypothetical protein